MESLFQDIRYGLRLLARSPGFALIAVLALALGIGGNSAMFTVVNSVLLKPLPFRDPARLYMVSNTNPSRGFKNWGTSPPDWRELRDRNRTLESLAAFYFRPVNITGTENPERVRSLFISSNLLPTLGVDPQLGRNFNADEEQWEKNRVALISDSLWRNRFAANPGVLGQTITLDGDPYTIVGVLPAAFTLFDLPVQLWRPISFAPGDNDNTHNNYFMNMVGRLKPGVTREQAKTDLNAIADDIATRFPENKGVGVDMNPLHEAWVGDVRPALLMLMAGVGFVLLIACANIANLLLARAAGRQKETAVRTALGASRSRLVRQLITESLVLGILGGAAGLLLAYWGTHALRLMDTRTLPRASGIGVDPRVLAFTFIASIVSGVLFGIMPALQSSRANINDVLKEGGRGSGQGERHRARAALVVTEVALSLVLLVGAGLMISSLLRLRGVNPGFDATNVLTMQLQLPAKKYIDPELAKSWSPRASARASAFMGEVIARIRTLPGVQAVGASSGLPLNGENWGKTVTFYDRPLPSSIDKLPHMQFHTVAGDYFRALGIRILQGRALDEHDALDNPLVVVVNREFVRQYFKDEDPIGKIVSVDPPVALVPGHTAPPGYKGPGKFTVVGVVDDVRYDGLSQPLKPDVYATFAQQAQGFLNMYLTVRASGDPRALVPAIRRVVSELDRDQPVANISTMQETVSLAVAQPKMETELLALFGGVAMLLAAIGIYGVISSSVTQRTHEIGVRMALGARATDVLAMVVRQGAILIAAGLAIGVIGALAATRLMKSLLYEVSATDPVVFAAVFVSLGFVAVLASYIPARRATKVDPMVALRYE